MVIHFFMDLFHKIVASASSYAAYEIPRTIAVYVTHMSS